MRNVECGTRNGRGTSGSDSSLPFGSAFWLPRSAFALLLLAAPAPQQDPWPTLDHAAAVWDTVRTLSADFVQIITNPMIGGPDTTRGRLFLEPPARFAMRFRDPAGDRIVADGRALWLYTPSTTPGQVIRTAIPALGGTGPNLLAQFLERPRERYSARWSRAEGADDVVSLRPRDPGAPYLETLLWIGRDDGLVRRMEIAEATGQRRVIALTGVRVNGGVDRREFSFAPPAGVRVVDR
jgi:outer membrane lipoprotein carrier protein